MTSAEKDAADLEGSRNRFLFFLYVKKCDNCKQEIKGTRQLSCRTRLARVLILRTLRKANHRVPEKNASFFSPKRPDSSPIGFLTQQWNATDAVFSSSPFSSW